MEEDVLVEVVLVLFVVLAEGLAASLALEEPVPEPEPGTLNNGLYQSPLLRDSIAPVALLMIPLAMPPLVLLLLSLGASEPLFKLLLGV